MMKKFPASFYEKQSDRSVICTLCPRRCRIAEGENGFCRVRGNRGGILYTRSYGRPAAIQVDRIEQRHFSSCLPGSRTFSVGTAGCNLDCDFCKNTACIHRVEPEGAAEFLPPEEVATLAKFYHCDSINFSFNEPTVFAEYAIDIARAAHRENLKTLLSTNGYILLEAAREFYREIDGASFELRSVDRIFYRRYCGIEFEPIAQALEYFRSLDKPLEISTLIIPEANDSEAALRALFSWVSRRLGAATPLHLLKFRPGRRMLETPPMPLENLLKIREWALQAGLRQIFVDDGVRNVRAVG